MGLSWRGLGVQPFRFVCVFFGGGRGCGVQVPRVR